MRAIWLAVSIAALLVAGVAVLKLRFEHHVVNTGYGIYVLKIDRLARNACAHLHERRCEGVRRGGN